MIGDRAANTMPALTERPNHTDFNLPDAADMLEWDREQRRIAFRNYYRYHPGDVFRTASPLPLGRNTFDTDHFRYRLDGAEHSLEEYYKRSFAEAFLVLSRGKVVIEWYADGLDATSLWTSRSVAKSVVSVLVGIALAEGAFSSLDDQITVYKPELAGTAWDGCTLRHLLQHTSGVDWNEDYNDAGSHFSRLTALEAETNPYGKVSELVHGLQRRPGVAPGEYWSYCTGGAWLLGDIVERATGKPLAGYLEQKVWRPFGMDREGVWHAYEPGVHDMGGHGFNATLQDWGRLGLFVLQSGRLPDGTRILPEKWIEQSRTWTTARNSVSEAYPEGKYGFQWWNNRIPENLASSYEDLVPYSRDALWALGIFGQMIAVSHSQDLVMVQWSSWEEAEPETLKLEASVLMASLARELGKR